MAHDLRLPQIYEGLRNRSTATHLVIFVELTSQPGIQISPWLLAIF